MCGIVGFINLSDKHSPQARDAFKQLLLMDTIRGPHSTGIAKVMMDKAHVYKDAEDAWTMLDRKETVDFLAPIAIARYLIGHNRWATRGAVTKNNSHPFQHGGITLVHNGSLHTVYGLPNHHEFDVDSENICYSISKLGIQETTPKMDGSFSLVWHDESDNSINFCRNDQRPMWFCESEDDKGAKFLFFGSEAGMIRWVLQRNGMKAKVTYATEPLKHYKFHFGKELPSIQPVEPFRWKNYSRRTDEDDTWGLEGYGRWYHGCQGVSTTKVPAVTKPATETQTPVLFRPQENKVVPIIGVRKGTETQLMDEMVDFWKRYKSGDKLKFSLLDFKILRSRPGEGCHLALEGKPAGETKLKIKVTGNFFGDPTETMDSLCYMTGTIISQHAAKEVGGEFRIGLKNIEMTDEIDEAFLEEKCDVCGGWEAKEKIQTVVYKGKQARACNKCGGNMAHIPAIH